MTTTLDIPALRAKLRVYDQSLPRCTKVITRVSNHAPDYVAEEERGEWEMRLSYPCGELEGHEGQCREGRAVLGWPGFATVTALLDEVERLRAEVERTEHLRSSLDTALMVERERERAVVVDYLSYRIEMSHYSDAINEFVSARDEIGEGVHHTLNYDDLLP